MDASLIDGATVEHVLRPAGLAHLLARVHELPFAQQVHPAPLGRQLILCSCNIAHALRLCPAHPTWPPRRSSSSRSCPCHLTPRQPRMRWMRNDDEERRSPLVASENRTSARKPGICRQNRTYVTPLLGPLGALRHINPFPYVYVSQMYTSLFICPFFSSDVRSSHAARPLSSSICQVLPARRPLFFFGGGGSSAGISARRRRCTRGPSRGHPRPCPLGVVAHYTNL